jgi:hypothetical protein
VSVDPKAKRSAPSYLNISWVQHIDVLHITQDEIVSGRRAWERRGKVTDPAGARALEESFAPAEVPRIRCWRALEVALGLRRGCDGRPRVRRTSRVAHEERLWGHRSGTVRPVLAPI